jgi:PAS domain S-box-containing protein
MLFVVLNQEMTFLCYKLRQLMFIRTEINALKSAVTNTSSFIWLLFSFALYGAIYPECIRAQESSVHSDSAMREIGNRPAYPHHDALRFKHLSKEDGLPHTNVNCVLQDRQGFMWFGSHGLCKYDGRRIKVYKPRINDPGAMLFDVRVIHEASDGILWVGTDEAGLARFDPLTEVFTVFQYKHGDPTTLSDKSITALLEDRKGILWVGTNWNGINRFDPKTQEITRYPFFSGHQNAEGLYGRTVKGLHQDTKGRIWIVTGRGVCQLDPATGQFKHCGSGAEGGVPSDLKNITTVMRHAADPYLVFGTAGRGMYELNLLDEVLQHFPLHEDSTTERGPIVSAICEDSVDGLWLGTKDGLLGLDQNNTITTHYTHDPGDPRSLNSNLIRCLYQDRSDMIWVGTGRGVSRFDPSPQPLTIVRRDQEEGLQEGLNNVSVIDEDRSGGLWIGTSNDGLRFRDSTKGQWKSYRHDPADPNSLAHNRVSDIQISGQDPNIVWIGHSSKGFSRLDRNTGQITQARHMMNEQNKPSDGRINCLFEDREHTLWIGTWFGLNWLDQETLQFGHYPPDASDPDLKIPVHISAIAEDASGALWVGTSRGGLYRLDDKEAGRFTRYLSDPNDERSLSHDHVRSLFRDSRGVLWVGTRDGVSRYDSENDSFMRFLHSHFPFGDHGWAHLNDIQAMLEDNEGRLWVGSQDGLHVLSELAAPNIRVRRIETLSGYRLGTFRPRARLRGRNGVLYFGTPNGLFAIHPERKSKTDPPQVVLTDLKLFNESVPIAPQGTFLTRHLSVSEEVTLGHDQSLITIDFAALDYVNPSQNQYAYRLEGLVDDWVHLGDQASVTFTNLDPGDYVFQVKAANSHGVWGETGTGLRLIITPFWWETAWFKTLVIVFAVGGTFAVFMIHMHMAKVQQHRLERTVDERTQQLGATSEQLAAARDGLELQVQQRTAELEQEMVEREQTHQALLESQSLLMGFITAADDAICIRDCDQRIILWNEAFAREIKANCGVDVCIGMRAEDYIPAQVLAGYDKQHERMLKAFAGKAAQAMYTYPCRGGEICTLDVRWYPVWDDGKVMAVSEITRDITEREKTKQQLIEAERRYRTVALSTTDIIREIDPETGRFEWISDQGESKQVREFSLPNSVDEWFDMIHPEDRDRVCKISQTAFATGHYFFLAYRIRSSMGDYRYWEDRASVIQGGSGEKCYWIGACTDVTERQLIERARQESELKYRSVVENAREMIFVSQEGMIQYHNPQALAWTGYSHEEMISVPFIDFIHPEDRDTVLQEYQDRISGKKTFAQYVIRMLTKNGDARWIIVNSASITWENRPASLAMITDITDQKLAEQTQQESERKHRRLFENMAQGVVYQKSDGQISAANPAAIRILGLSLDQLTGRTSMDPRWRATREDGVDFPGEEHPAIVALKAGQPQHAVLMQIFNPQMNAFRWIEIDAIPVFNNDDDKPVQVYSIFTDITVRRIAEAKLRKSESDLRENQSQLRHFAGRLLAVQEEERRRLARELHDDLSQRLAVLAIEAGKTEEELKRMEDPTFVKIKRIREKIVSVSSDVHSISRQLHPSILDDLGLEDAMRSEINAFSVREKIDVAFQSQKLPGVIPKDIALVAYRIMQECLRNSAKHAKANRAEVCLYYQDNSIGLSVRDDGVGFELLAIHAKPGLGLTSIQERARLVGGTVDITTAPGQGTEIRTILPLGQS